MEFLMIVSVFVMLFVIFIAYKPRPKQTQQTQPQTQQTQQPTQPQRQGQPSKAEMHKVINFMYYNNIITYEEHQKIITKSLPYIM